MTLEKGIEHCTPMAKRLRGWELQMESGVINPPPKKSTKALEKAPGEKESMLGNKLLMLWATGVLPATLIRELADLAMQDGADHKDLIAIAKTGNWGQQPGNAHKQIMSHFCSNVGLAESYEIEVPLHAPQNRTGGFGKGFHLFAPHDVFQLGAKLPRSVHGFV